MTIAARLQKERISKLYHFTSIKNLEGIARHQSILSKRALEELREWPVPEPGGNALSHQLDRRKGNWDHVSLNLTPWTPMAYNSKFNSHLCFFEIRPDVAIRRGVIFTDSNATRSAQERGEGIDGLDSIRFDMVRSYPQPWNRDWFDFSQAEVLVPRNVSMDEVFRVVFVSDASLREGMRIWGSHKGPNFEVDRTVFANYPYRGESIDFSHVANISLTSEKVVYATAWNDYKTRGTFRRDSCKTVTAVIEVWAVAGAIGTARWRPSDKVDRTTFGQTNKYRWYPDTSLSKMPNGRCSVEVRLNDTAWITCEFEVI